MLANKESAPFQYAVCISFKRNRCSLLFRNSLFLESKPESSNLVLVAAIIHEIIVPICQQFSKSFIQVLKLSAAKSNGSRKEDTVSLLEKFMTYSHSGHVFSYLVSGIVKLSLCKCDDDHNQSEQQQYNTCPFRTVCSVRYKLFRFFGVITDRC